VCGHTRNVVTYSKFHWNPFRGVGATGDRGGGLTLGQSHYWLLQ